MKKKLKKFFFIGLICFISLMNVQAKQNLKIKSFNSPSMVGIVKKLDSNNVLCTGKFGFFLKQVLQLFKFAVPVIIISLSIVDFVKAMSTQKQEEVKLAANKLVKRLIIGAIIFILPTIIDFLLDIAGITSSTCGW